MQDLIICGIGCHALEMAEIVERINRVTATWNLLGFFSEKNAYEKHQGLILNGYPVLGTIESLEKFPNAALAPGYGFKDAFPMERAATIIDPTTFVSRSAKIGKACVIYPSCYIGYNAVLGNRIFSLSGSVINHDDVLGDDVCLCSNVTLAGNLHVEAGVYMGQASTVRQHLRIGKDSFIGMGAVVVSDVPPNVVMVGNPARKLKDRFAPK